MTLGLTKVLLSDVALVVTLISSTNLDMSEVMLTTSDTYFPRGLTLSCAHISVSECSDRTPINRQESARDDLIDEDLAIASYGKYTWHSQHNGCK